MSNQDLKQVSAMTGTFAALALKPENVLGGDAPNGNSRIGPGKELPQQEMPDLELLAQDLNIAVQRLGRDLRFQVDLKGGRSVIQVLDSETGEIIRQIPPENAKTYVSDVGVVALRLYDRRV